MRMQCNSYLKVLLLAASTGIFLSCTELVTAPTMQALGGSQSGGTNNTIASPQNLFASQGEKRTITLSWTEVHKAVRYYVYASPTPFGNFPKVGETSTRLYTYDAMPGVTRYFKVTAVSYAGTESKPSLTVSGTTLAQPVINDIQQTENTDSVTISWYMENTDAYCDALQYTITCRGNSDVIRTETIAGGANGISAPTSYTFTNLKQNTKYKYTVEAFLKTAQEAVETSDAVDAETAASLKPSAPDNMHATGGVLTNMISLSFTLPEKANVKQTTDMGTGGQQAIYSKYPLYFKIVRRIAAGDTGTEYSWMPLEEKMYYSPSEPNKWTSTEPTSLEAYNAAYTEGATVTYIDTSDLVRGIKYEYKIQSYIYKKNTTSSSSSSSAVGWEAAVPLFELSNITSVPDNELHPTKNIKTSVRFKAAWTSHGKESDYVFIVKEDHNDIADNYSGSKYMLYESLAGVNAAVLTYDTQDAASTNCGYYTYTMYIVSKTFPHGAAELETAVHNALDSAPAQRSALVTSEIDLPKASITVDDGYGDKAVISWNYDSETDYTLKRYTADENGYKIEGTLKETDNAALGTTGSYTDTTLENGKAYIYVLCAKYKTGTITILSDPVTAYTLGVPFVTFDADSPAYSAITISWKPVQKADIYTVTLTCDSITVTGTLEKNTTGSSYTASEHTSYTIGETGQIIYMIGKPAGYDDAQISGKPFTCTVSASNSKAAAASAPIQVRTLGPAETNVTATLAQSADRITATWNTVQGAAGYFVLRDRCDILNDKILSSDVYFVPATPTGSTNEIQANKEIISGASAVITGNTITLTDTYTASPATGMTVWQDNQDKLAWGYPYRYTVFPAKSADDTYDVSAVSENGKRTQVTIRDVVYQNVDKIFAAGSTLGCGFAVTATKSESPDSVTIVWQKPYGITTQEPKLWRKRMTGSGAQWEKTTELVDAHGNFVVAPTGNERTVPYGYAVVYSDEAPHATYLTSLSVSDPKSPSEPLNKGYAFAITCTADNIKNGIAAGFGERIGWTLWNYDERAVGPDPGKTYELYIKNSDYNANWNKIATVSQDGSVTLNNKSEYAVTITPSNESLSIIPVLTNDTHSGLLQVLRDYKHYAKMEITRTLSDGTHITASYSDGDPFAYREITPKEFALVSALSLATAMYRDMENETTEFLEYSKEGTWWTRRIFYFNKNKGPFFQTISGTLRCYASTTGPKMPKKYGHYDNKNWGDLGGGGDPDPCTLTLASQSIYTGSATITSMENGGGSYTVKYRSEENGKNFREFVSSIFSYGSLASPENYDWSATENKWK